MVASFTFHANPCLCSNAYPILDIYCAHATNLQIKTSGVGVTFMVNSRLVGSLFKSSKSQRDCASIISLYEALRSVKELPAIAAPLFFNFCFLAQSVHICSITLCERNKVHQAYLLARFAASSRIHSEADISYPFDNE
ncbi:hypothetical protein RHMOL_Rhmol11G0082800 [Rhododendron molle]|uniref:Uncharacterized protein n=1 Tax=Rhododendron molle TaxID=49168 RepID=A0ACC0LR12_RHOML|nr:hypothetical protein RHMOL_Rhmol11G0082800 [Rhododendron molle]